MHLQQLRANAGLINIIIWRRRRRRAPNRKRVWTRPWLDVGSRLHYRHFYKSMPDRTWNDAWKVCLLRSSSTSKTWKFSFNLYNLVAGTYYPTKNKCHWYRNWHRVKIMIKHNVTPGQSRTKIGFHLSIEWNVKRFQLSEVTTFVTKMSSELLDSLLS